jgi:hypothetical protein
MKKNSIFPIVVLVFSFLGAVDAIFSSSNWLGLINSIIGIAGGTLYFLKNEKYRQFINVWICLQFIVLTKTVSDPDSYNQIVSPVIDLTQFLKFKFGFSLTFNHTSYTLSFNVVPLLYLFAFKKLQTADLIGVQLELRRYRDNEVLNGVLPQTVTVIEAMDFGKNNGWLLAQLSVPILLNEKSYAYCLLRGKDDLPIVPDKNQQMAHLRLVDDVAVLRATQQLNEYPFIDWVFVI